MVLEGGSEFAEIRDIISRYDTLAATNAELVERARTAQEKTEMARIKYLASTEV